MTEKIGSVTLDLRAYPGEDKYSDGEIENELLNMVSGQQNLAELLAKDNRWPVLYHLSAERQHIIDVMDIRPDDTLLEIGAGCGALTGGFADRAKSVHCAELSKKRSSINAQRNRHRENIEIKVGNFADITFDRQYDVVTLIGVLEYAQSYMAEYGDPYGAFLEKINGLLKPGGRLYIAIENKYGLKYFAGAAEDHTGVVFDGIEDYAGVSGVQTFAKSELAAMLQGCGYSGLYFYYPLPDYKFASVIYSDDYLPKEGEMANLVANYDRPRDVLFAEEFAYNGLIRAGYFDIFANSFLIEAVKGD